jgi:gamma-glutamyltranspeptidase/glutathione hydrolase
VCPFLTFPFAYFSFTAVMIMQILSLFFRSHDAEWYDPHGYEILDDTGTSALVAADASGLVISLTTTVNLSAILFPYVYFERSRTGTNPSTFRSFARRYWGSRIMVPESGIVLNDAMDDFSVEGRTNAFGYLPTPSNYSTLSFC